MFFVARVALEFPGHRISPGPGRRYGSVPVPALALHPFEGGRHDYGIISEAGQTGFCSIGAPGSLAWLSVMQPVAADSETLERFRHLLFLLPPLLLYVLAVVLFEASADPEKPFTPLLLKAVQAGAVPGVEQALAEIKARLAWLAAALLNIVVSLVAMIYSIVTLRRLVGPGQLIVTAVIGGLLGAGILGQLAFGAGQGSVMYQLVFGFTYSILTHAGGFGELFLQQVYVIIALINVLATSAPVFILMTTCATVASLAVEDEPEHMVVRARHLKEAIAVASAFLVVGVLHMSVWLGWTSSITNDPGLQSGLSGVASAVSAYWGVAFTIVLIGAYVPPALYLNKRAQALLRERGHAMTPEELEQWLSERGLSFKLSNQLTQYLSIMAPFLAAPLSATMRFS